MNNNGKLNPARLGAATPQTSSMNGHGPAAPGGMNVNQSGPQVRSAGDIINVNRVSQGQPVTPGQRPAVGTGAPAPAMGKKVPAIAPIPMQAKAISKPRQ